MIECYSLVNIHQDSTQNTQLKHSLLISLECPRGRPKIQNSPHRSLSFVEPSQQSFVQFQLRLWSEPRMYLLRDVEYWSAVGVVTEPW